MRKPPPLQPATGKTAPEPWRLEPWMEAYRPFFALVDPLEIDHVANLPNDRLNSDNAFKQVAIFAQAALLKRLMNAGLLLAERATKGSELL